MISFTHVVKLVETDYKLHSSAPTKTNFIHIACHKYVENVLILTPHHNRSSKGHCYQCVSERAIAKAGLDLLQCWRA